MGVAEHGLRAPAKINWTLRVVGRRPDGYHELESLVAPVSLFDELELIDRDDGRVTIACDVPGVPTDERNLVCKAALALRHAAGISQGVSCRLLKRIPSGAGLGGGSSDAAATLLGLNRMWCLNWPLERLLEVGARVGSDVCLFLPGGPVMMTGRGEHVRPAAGWSGWVVLLLPGYEVSTPAVYGAFASSGGDGASGSSEPVAQGCDAREWMNRTFNMLEPPAIRVCPPLGELMARAAELADRTVRMSGSGSTVYTAFDTQPEAETFAMRVSNQLGVRTEVVRPLERQAVWCE